MPILSASPSVAVRPEDAKAAQALVEHLTKAWNVNDATSLVEVYADDASIVLPGAVLIGKPAIEEWMAEAFRTKWKGTHVLGHLIELRYLREDIMLMVSHGGAYHPGATEVPEKFAIRGIWTYVKTDGEWLIHGYGNTPVGDTIPLPPSHL
jgi:uncharacterized protein (TIGR02246 family)